MLNRYIIIVTIINTMLLISCEENLDTNISGGENELVVNATLCPDSTISLTLSKSKNILDETDIEYINEANIYVYEYKVLVDTLNSKENGLYIGNIKPSISKAYTIKVETRDAGIAEATDSIPETVLITKIDTSVVINTSSKLLNCAITITDPANRENFYLLKVLSADELNPKNIQKQDFTCLDAIIMDSDVEGILDGGNIIYFNDAQINGKTHSLVVSMIFPQNKIVYFQLWSISKALYNYCFSVEFNRANNAALFSERMQINSNIRGGLGIMGTYSITTDSIVVK